MVGGEAASAGGVQEERGCAADLDEVEAGGAVAVHDEDGEVGVGLLRAGGGAGEGNRRGSSSLC